MDVLQMCYHRQAGMGWAGMVWVMVFSLLRDIRFRRAERSGQCQVQRPKLTCHLRQDAHHSRWSGYPWSPPLPVPRSSPHSDTCPRHFSWSLWSGGSYCSTPQTSLEGMEERIDRCQIGYQELPIFHLGQASSRDMHTPFITNGKSFLERTKSNQTQP